MGFESIQNQTKGFIRVVFFFCLIFSVGFYTIFIIFSYFLRLNENDVLADSLHLMNDSSQIDTAVMKL